MILSLHTCFMAALLPLIASSEVLATSALALPSDTTSSWQSSMAEELERSLVSELLEVWYPRVVDEEEGGYLTTFSHDWQLQGSQNKFIVTQARHVWTTARAAERYPDALRYEHAAGHGARFLMEKFWDGEHGGFHELLTREGEPIASSSGDYPKRAYGNAFGIYALAAYYEVTGDEKGLHVAQEAFRWLDDHAHDPEFGGYFQFMTQDGTPIREGAEGFPPKDQNSSIHLLEAFTELYRVWPDSVLGDRLEELLRIIRDTIVTDRGYMNLFFQPDWTPVLYTDSSASVREAHFEIDHVSFGHDVETAFLMLEASEALGISIESRTLPVAKRMVDHALDTGFDHERGGFYDRGYYFRGDDELTVILPTKNWWAQAEGLNTLLIMADLFPSDPRDYAALFRKQWSYIDRYLIDHRHGGWYSGGLDVEPERATMSKAQMWKASYHDGRALLRVTDRLRGRH